MVSSSRSNTREKLVQRTGCGQLSLVEHSLCPLDARVSLRSGLVHRTSFQYTDPQRKRKTAQVEVSCPRGLSAHDEFYLWGLLSLTLCQSPTETELHVTPHFCLRQLGLVNAQSRRGGRQYQQFAAAVERLSWVRYGCDAFYDPVRMEHCQVRFGFFSFRLPLDPASNRAWRFHWDTQFLEFVRGAGGSLRFDLERYRRLSPAARRLFLFVSKLFPRLPQTPRMELRQLAIEIVGLSPGLPTKHLLAKTRRICAELADEDIIKPLDPATIQRQRSGNYQVVLVRHDRFDQQQGSSLPSESPLVEPLQLLGLEPATIARVLRGYSTSRVREWIDITFAAQERFGKGFFKRSPAAYFLDNLQKSVTTGRTPPDWWLDIRKAEERRQATTDRTRHRRSAATATTTAASRQSFAAIRQEVFGQLQSAGLPAPTAMREATRRAQRECLTPAAEGDVPLTSAASILASLPLKLR